MPAKSDVHDYIKDYAMFVSSSDYEGMSNALIEAMAMGVPVISTDHPIGGARMLIQNNVNGVLVPVNDTEEMISKIEMLISNEDYLEKISNEALKIKEELEIGKITNDWLNFIDECLKNEQL